MSEYTSFAKFYDTLITDVDYNKIACFLDKIIKQNNKDSSLLLELGCGSGNLTFLLSQKGYDVIALDNSAEMLSIARQKSYENELSDILFLQQDMTEFELYGTVDVIVSCLDCINYLKSKNNLDKCFKLVWNYLNLNGLFIFDINSEYKLRNEVQNNSFIYQTDNLFCVWQNELEEDKNLVHFDLTVFEKEKGQTYHRYDESQSEGIFSFDDIKTALEKAKMTLICTFDDYEDKEINDKTKRIVFVAKANK